MKRNDWHLREADSVLAELQTDMYTGLSAAEAVRRRKKGGANRIWYIRRTSVKETMLACLSDLATLLLVITAVFAAVFEESRMAFAIVGVLLLGAVLRTAAYCKARRILEDNALEGIPTCSVLRDGKMLLLPADELVPGDIVFLEGGGMVPADGRIVAGEEMAVSERGITANRETVQKFETVIRTEEKESAIPAEYRSNLLYAGSTVLWGQARMAVTATGADTLIVRKQGGIRVPAGEKLPFENRLNRWCRASSLIMLACVLVITALALFLGHGFTNTFLTSMALAVASMSEYLTTIAYIIIAVAMQDTGRRRGGKTSEKQRKAAVINDSAAIARIAGIKRLVLSDIRLLKSGEMALHSWYADGKLHDFSRFGADRAEEDLLRNLLKLSLATVGGQKLHTSLSGGAITAMPEKFTMLQKAADELTKLTERPVTYSFTDLDRVDGGVGISGGLDTVLIQEKGDVSAVVSGDIDRVLHCCQFLEIGGQPVPLDEAKRKQILAEAAHFTGMGARVIACARRNSPYTSLNRLSLLQSAMIFVGFCAVAEPPAQGVRDNIEKLKKAGVSLILLSEVPERDLYYGREIGLFDDSTAVLTRQSGGTVPASGNMLVEMPPVLGADLSRNVNDARVRFLRLQMLLSAWKDKTGKARRTAVLVRSVLDARMLTLGDVAVAVGDSDTRPLSQPLKAKADVIVYPGGGCGGLTETVEAMCQSRRALYHMWSAAVFLGTSQISRMVLLLLAVIFGYAMPSAAVLVGIGLVMDFAAVLVMAFIRAPEDALSISGQQMGLPGSGKTIAAILGTGLLWGILQGCLPVVCTLLGTSFTGTLTAAILLTQLCLSGSMGQRGSFFRCRFHAAYILYALFAMVCAAAALLTDPALWYTYFFALVPPVVLTGVWELIKGRLDGNSPKKKREKKRKKTEEVSSGSEEAAAETEENAPEAEEETDTEAEKEDS